ncbi:MAG: hypothetical protein HKN46_09210 [Acidimicrobiia bacterium]|nr:hypothetical protein [Acidimicrobiia bacterium]
MIDRYSPEQRRTLLLWEIGSITFVMLAGSMFHFIYELSGFSPVAAAFGSVNESTWEHLKLFFWPGLAVALVQHAFVKDFAANYWWAKAVGLLTVPVGVIFAFYAYVGVIVPLQGEGTLAGAIGTGLIGVLIGSRVTWRILNGAERPKNRAWLAAGVFVGLTAAFIGFTFAPPEFFLFEDFLGYRYRGEYGILEDYTEHLVFVDVTV